MNNTELYNLKRYQLLEYVISLKKELQEVKSSNSICTHRMKSLTDIISKQAEEMKQEVEELKEKVEKLERSHEILIDVNEKLADDKYNLKKLVKDTGCYWKCYCDFHARCDDDGCVDKKHIDDWVKREAFTPSYSYIKEYLYKEFDIDEEDDEEGGWGGPPHFLK